jgi:hypothetical protein
MVALAIPPPSHIVCDPYRPPRCSNALTSVVMLRAPLAPSGCPIAIAPPFVLAWFDEAVEKVTAAIRQEDPRRGQQCLPFQSSARTSPISSIRSPPLSSKSWSTFSDSAVVMMVLGPAGTWRCLTPALEGRRRVRDVGARCWSRARRWWSPVSVGRCALMLRTYLGSEPNVARMKVMSLARTGLYAVHESAFDEVQHARAREFEGWASRG